MKYWIRSPFTMMVWGLLLIVGGVAMLTQSGCAPTDDKPTLPQPPTTTIKQPTNTPILVSTYVDKFEQQPSVNEERVSFVPNQQCAECHPQQIADWLGSHHEQAMQPATAETVLADFDDVTFMDEGITSRFFQEGGRFFVNTIGLDGQLADFEIKYTFGITPLQQYLVELPRGRYQAFTVAWDTINHEWFNLQPNEKIAPDDPLHWTQRRFTWNSSCAECHSTNLTLNYDLETDSYQTSWSEINVSCQACHGPGSDHVAWAERADKPEGDMGLVVDYKQLDSVGVIETCARCHSRRYPTSLSDAHGRPYLDDFMPELLRESLYHADGQILDEVYVYGSFIQSKMYHTGVSCLDCHDPHTLQTRRPGNELCTACHQESPPTMLFETLKASSYDTPDHHFHETDSLGSACVACHMPATTYMVVDPRRDHRFGNPRPDLSVILGVPNACTDCHTDQSAEWAVDMMTAWYGSTWQVPQFAETFAAGRAGEVEAISTLITLAQNNSQPAMVRATALELLYPYGEPALAAMLSGLKDGEPLVRMAAVQGVAKVSSEPQAEPLLTLLTDPIRAVRIEASNAIATTLSPEAIAQFTTEQQATYQTGLAEYVEAQMKLADHPEGHFNLGRLYSHLNEPLLAEQAYQTAIDKDPHFFPAHNNLANFYYQTGRLAEAEATFRQALETTTDQGMLYYSLGLLLAEQKRLDEAVKELAHAAELLPNQPRVHYNYGLILQQLSQLSAAETALLEAYALQPTDPEILYGVITVYMQQEDWPNARLYAQQLTEHYPDVVEFQQLYLSLQQKGN